MIVGVPREIKSDEYRVAMLPVGVEELIRHGHRVLIERGAGLGSGIPDESYAIHGAEIIEGPETDSRTQRILDLLKHQEPVAPKPQTERQARDEFYKSLHRHADGRGTIEEVEAAYRELLPYRR